MPGREVFKTLIITNNTKVLRHYEDRYEVLFVDGPALEVLIAARDRIHRGQKLLTHPLAGSVKPNESPFKSVALSREAGKLDLDSLVLIENSIATFEKFSKIKRPDLGENAGEKMKDDFREIDLSLFTSAIG